MFFEIGKAYFFRTVTFHLVGKAKGIKKNWIELENASWIADSGRFMQAIQNGALGEVEPVGLAYINIETVTDAFPWVHPLPDKQK